MKLLSAGIACICMLCVVAAGSCAETKIIESEATLIINGQKIISPFNVVLSRDGITVNGIEFPLGDRFHVEFDPLPAKIKPSMEDEAYIDWLIKTSIKLTNDMLAAGNNTEDAWKAAKEFLDNNTDGEVVRLWGENGSYYIKHRDQALPVGFNLPIEFLVIHPLTKEEKLRNRYLSLCTYLKLNMQIINNDGCYEASSMHRKKPEDKPENQGEVK